MDCEWRQLLYITYYDIESTIIILGTYPLHARSSPTHAFREHVTLAIITYMYHQNVCVHTCAHAHTHTHTHSQNTYKVMITTMSCKELSINSNKFPISCFKLWSVCKLQHRVIPQLQYSFEKRKYNIEKSMKKIHNCHLLVKLPRSLWVQRSRSVTEPVMFRRLNWKVIELFCEPCKIIL